MHDALQDFSLSGVIIVKITRADVHSDSVTYSFTENEVRSAYDPNLVSESHELFKVGMIGYDMVAC